jgi:hypothetical protein
MELGRFGRYWVANTCTRAVGPKSSTLMVTLWLPPSYSASLTLGSLIILSGARFSNRQFLFRMKLSLSHYWPRWTVMLMVFYSFFSLSW